MSVNFMNRRNGIRRLLFIIVPVYFLCSVALSDITVNYGTVSLDYNSPGFAAADTFDLVVGDVELSFTINTGGVSGDWTYYAKVGLTSSMMNEGNFNGPDSAYGCIEMLVGDHQDSCEVDTSEKFALKNSNYGEWESLYDAYGPGDIRSPVGLTDGNNPLGRFYNMWFDRGWYQWTSITPRTIPGVNVVTNGVYHVKVIYHAVDSNTATMFATINDENQGFYTQAYWDSYVDPCGVVREKPDVNSIGLSFHTDLRNLKVFAGTHSINDAGAATITDLAVKQEISVDINALADFAEAWLCSEGETCFNGRFDYVTDNIINFSDFAVFANNFVDQLNSPPPPNNENCIQWKLDDNADSDVVVGNEVNAQFVDWDPCATSYTSAVASTVNGFPAFHLNGGTQYVCVTVPNVWPSARADLWTKYSGNPVINWAWPIYSYFGGLCKNPAGGWYFYASRFFGGRASIYRWDSNDLISWTTPVKVLADSARGSWDEICAVAHVFQDTNGLWNLFYRGQTGSAWHIGKATSTDGNVFTRVIFDEDNPGLLDQFGSNYDFTCIILVDGIYYAYVSGHPNIPVENIYTSTDLQTFTAYSGNPVISNGFCASVWKSGGYYYMVIPRDFNYDLTLYSHVIGLYRSTKPTFDANSRDFLGYTVVNDQTYDIRYFDTPSIPVTDVNRNVYAPEFNDTLYMMYAGQSSFYSWTQNLASTSLSGLSSLKPRFHQFFGEKYSISCWVQFDTVDFSEPVFSIGSAFDDSSTVLKLTLGPTKKWTLTVAGTAKTGSNVPEVNTPYLVTIVNNCDIVNLYVNGVFEVNSTTAFTNTDDYYLYFGTGGATKYLDGYVWDCRVYPAALNAAEVDRLYRTGSIRE
jgi:hypothetical protein